MQTIHLSFLDVQTSMSLKTLIKASMVLAQGALWREWDCVRITGPWALLALSKICPVRRWKNRWEHITNQRIPQALFKYWRWKGDALQFYTNEGQFLDLAGRTTSTLSGTFTYLLLEWGEKLSHRGEKPSDGQQC
jgi:hypothetical protein